MGKSSVDNFSPKWNYSFSFKIVPYIIIMRFKNFTAREIFINFLHLVLEDLFLDLVSTFKIYAETVDRIVPVPVLNVMVVFTTRNNCCRCNFEKSVK